MTLRVKLLLALVLVIFLFPTDFDHTEHWTVVRSSVLGFWWCHTDICRIMTMGEDSPWLAIDLPCPLMPFHQSCFYPWWNPSYE